MDALKEWSQFVQAVYGSGSVRSYTYGVGRFQKFMDGRLLQASPSDIQAFLAQEGQEWAPATLQWMMACLKSFYGWAIQGGLVESSPVNGLDLPRRRSRRLPKVLSQDDVKVLIDYEFSTRDRAIILVMLDGGLRLAEVAHLRRTDVDLQGRTVLVLGKGDKERIVPLSDRLHEALETWIYESTEWGPLDPLFVGRKGPLGARGLGYVIQRAGEHAGLHERLSPHCLRHTFATRLLRRGVNLRVVQELLGHANLATTQIYTHVVAADMAEAIKKLD